MNEKTCGLPTQCAWPVPVRLSGTAGPVRSAGCAKSHLRRPLNRTARRIRHRRRTRDSRLISAAHTAFFRLARQVVRGGIDQARGTPNGWPEGGQGYADRFGSAMGEIAIRGTTEYVFADIFREDIRHQRCYSPCSVSAFKRAFEDSFHGSKGRGWTSIFFSSPYRWPGFR